MRTFVRLSRSADDAILDKAAAQGFVVVTLDADFHTILALSAAAAPSVIRLGVEGLKAIQMAHLIGKSLADHQNALETGSALTVGPTEAIVARCDTYEEAKINIR